ncbi:hypothetical protein B0H16DRAFT_881473 [Mycena metata]|uniref:Uncharacterized protein n=1 Tax=Mycena metata TaxID=1033252 RepID=A0AAD7K778_9AGAR|nr:hypothetical protein B0H16DRAFT_881473 [Mycena metata]
MSPDPLLLTSLVPRGALHSEIPACTSPAAAKNTCADSDWIPPPTPLSTRRPAGGRITCHWLSQRCLERYLQLRRTLSASTLFPTSILLLRSHKPHPLIFRVPLAHPSSSRLPGFLAVFSSLGLFRSIPSAQRYSSGRRRTHVYLAASWSMSLDPRSVPWLSLSSALRSTALRHTSPNNTLTTSGVQRSTYNSMSRRNI